MNTGNRLLKSICFIWALFCAQISSAFTVMPSDGIWGITSEQSLAVGRAFVLETSGNTTIVTFYNYNASGAPTFYVGGGLLTANNTVSLTFSEPKGGTCLGCQPTSGSLLSTPGGALFEFTSSTTGFVTLPGEPRKAIVKGNFGWADAPSGLLGGWVFGYLTTATGSTFADYAALTQIIAGTANGRGMAANSAINIACELQVSGAAQGYVLCVRLTTTNTNKSMVAKWWGHHMDGSWYYSDLSISTATPFAARRILNSSDQYTVKRHAELPADAEANAELLRTAISTLAQEFGK